MLPLRGKCLDRLHETIHRLSPVAETMCLSRRVFSTAGLARAKSSRSIPSGVGRGFTFGIGWTPPRVLSWLKGQTRGQLDHRGRHRGCAVLSPASLVPDEIGGKEPRTPRSLAGDQRTPQGVGGATRWRFHHLQRSLKHFQKTVRATKTQPPYYRVLVEVYPALRIW